MTPIAGILRRKPPPAAPRRAGRVGSGREHHLTNRAYPENAGALRQRLGTLGPPRPMQQRPSLLSVKINGALGRPVVAIRRRYNTSAINFRRRTLGQCLLLRRPAARQTRRDGEPGE
jgi:hypothetical protein